MYKARTVFSTLTPLAPRMCKPERFASWLVRSHPLTRTTQVLIAKSARKYSNRVATEPFLNGSSSSYVEEMYNAWLQDPHSVHVVSNKFIKCIIVINININIIIILFVFYYFCSLGIHFFVAVLLELHQVLHIRLLLLLLQVITKFH